MLSPDGAPPIDDAALFSSSLHPPPESAAVGPSCHRQVLVAGRERSLRDGEQAGGNPFSVCVCLCVCSAACMLYAVLLPGLLLVCRVVACFVCRVTREYTALTISVRFFHR
jgi:hypothetical protein